MSDVNIIEQNYTTKFTSLIFITKSNVSFIVTKKNSNNSDFGSAGLIYCLSVIGFCLFNAIIVLCYRLCFIPFLNRISLRINNNETGLTVNPVGNSNDVIAINNYNDDANKPPAYQSEVNQNGASSSSNNEIEKLPTYDEVQTKLGVQNNAFVNDV
jgi:hypothetical protein